jgi:hypothetical protein
MIGNVYKKIRQFMQMDIGIRLDIFGFIDVRSVVVETKLQRIKAINPTFHQEKECEN